MEISGRYLVAIDNITELMNLSESEYVRLVWGPKYLPLTLVLPITFVYVAIFVTGVFGNVVTCIVIRRNPVMQTATNYYLFNLAVSDLLLLILGESDLSDNAPSDSIVRYSAGYPRRNPVSRMSAQLGFKSQLSGPSRSSDANLICWSSSNLVPSRSYDGLIKIATHIAA